MGSFTGGNCYEQQIHCMATVGKNENERAVAFLQGCYTHVNGFTDQRKLQHFAFITGFQPIGILLNGAAICLFIGKRLTTLVLEFPPAGKKIEYTESYYT